jgi:hypothetical protein
MLSIRRDKNHILFGGTKVLQHTADKVDTSSELAVCAQFRC